MLYMSIMKLHMSTLAGILDDDYEMTKTYQFAVTCTCIHGKSVTTGHKIRHLNYNTKAWKSRV